MAVPIIAGVAALAKVAAKPTIKLAKKLAEKLAKKYDKSSSVTKAASLSGGTGAVLLNPLAKKKKDNKKKKPRGVGSKGYGNSGFKGHF